MKKKASGFEKNINYLGYLCNIYTGIVVVFRKELFLDTIFDIHLNSVISDIFR